MNSITRIQKYILMALCLVLPIALSTFTAEFYTTTKMYVLLVTMLVVAVLWALQLMISKKLHHMYAPFTTILTVLLIARALTTAFSTANWMQALFSIPTGGFVFLGLYLLYLLGSYVLTQQTTRSPLTLMSLLTYGTGIASLIIVVFYFHPIASAQLPQNLLFLKEQFSPIGNALDSLILIGAGVIVSIFAVHMSVGKKNFARATQNLLMVIMIGTAGVMIGITLYKASGTAFNLPPLSVSWYASVETLKSPKPALIGFGVDSFESLFTKVKPISYNITDTWNINYGLSRSALLHIWVESGLLGLVALLALIVYAIREVHGLFRAKVQSAGVFAVLGVYLLAVWFALPITFMTLCITILYLIDLGVAGRNIHDISDTQKQWLSLSSYPIIYTGLSIAVLAGVCGIGYMAQKTYRAEMAFKKSVDAIKRNDGKLVYDNLRMAVSLYPQNERFRSQFAQVNLLLANTIARNAQQKETGEKTPDGADGKSQSDQKTALSDQDRQAIAQFIQQAISEAKALVALNPDKASSWNTLAVIYRNVINVAEGAQAWTIASYQEALRRDPLNPQLMLNLGGVYYGAQKYDSATQTFQQAVISKPNWANAHYNLAWSLYQQGKYQQAVAVMNNVLQLIDPASKDGTIAKENLAMFKKKSSEKADTKAVDVPPVPEAKVPDVEPLELPETPEAQLSPALQLPEGSGPTN